MRIKRIKRINAGIFRDYRPDPKGPGFEQFNLIYGFNGCGKTTISKVLMSLQPNMEMEGDGWFEENDWNFEIETSDGSLLEKGGELSNTRVFNQKYVEDNLGLNYGGGQSPALLVIGEERIADTQELTEIEGKIAETETKTDDIDKQHKADKKALKEQATETAATIKSATGKPDYTATNLNKKFEKFQTDEEKILSEDELENKKKEAQAAAPRDEIQEVEFDKSKFEDYSKAVEELLKTDAIQVPIGLWQSHQEMLGWVEKGASYHEEHGIDECLLCGNELTDDRLGEIKSVFNAQYNNFIEGLEQAKATATTLLEDLSGMRPSLPQASLFNGNLKTQIESILPEAKKAFKSVRDIVESANAELSKKIDNAKYVPDDFPDIMSKLDELNNAIEKINKSIRDHNAGVTDFANQKKTAQDAIEAHHIQSIFKTRSLLKASIANGEKELKTQSSTLQMLTEKRSELQAKISQAELGADKMNALLRSFLGHGELSVEVKKDDADIDWFVLCRNGDEITAPPSEGEKSLLALIYFLISLEQETNVSELVVVIDDPFSSVDGGYILHGANEIKARTRAVGQVFYLTHNLSFMNQMKKWMIKNGQKKSGRELFVLETYNAGEERASKLRAMPKLLWQYESEYEYSFSLVLSLAENQGGLEHPNLFLMPNLVRKVLETFLAFRFPGQPSLANQIEVAGDQPNVSITPAELEALRHLADRESHANNLGMISDVPRVDEFSRIATATMTLIKELDEDHFERMKKVCEEGKMSERS